MLKILTTEEGKIVAKLGVPKVGDNKLKRYEVDGFTGDDNPAANKIGCAWLEVTGMLIAVTGVIKGEI